MSRSAARSPPYGRAKCANCPASPPAWSDERATARALRLGAANLLRAVLSDGSRVEGMVFPGELFWDDDPPPGANAEHG